MSVNKMELIKELRARTNSPFGDVRKALEATNYDIDAAIEWLKENGIVKAAKKSGRVAAEGAVTVVGDEKRAILVEINSETDFVAKNEKFLTLLNEVATALFNAKVASFEEALALQLENGLTVEAELLNATAVIGEKISLRRVLVVEAKEDEVLGIYVHANSQIASVTVLNGKNSEVARNVSMHVAALNPEFDKVSNIPAQRLETVKAGFVQPEGFEKKPTNIQEKIVEGWLDKQLSEFVLEKQPYVIDDSLTVEKYLKTTNSSLVNTFRFEVGEGIEKVQSDFASEVASMVK